MHNGSLFAPPTKLASAAKKFRQSLERQYPPHSVKPTGGPHYMLNAEGGRVDFSVHPLRIELQFTPSGSAPAGAAFLIRIFATARKYGLKTGYLTTRTESNTPSKRPSEIEADVRGPAALIDWQTYSDRDIATAFEVAIREGKEDFIRNMVDLLKDRGYFWWLTTEEMDAAEEVGTVE